MVCTMMLRKQTYKDLKPLVEHMYLEDRRQAILQVATNANITISYNPKMHKRNYRCKTKLSKLVTSNVPVGKRAVGLRVSMEFFDDDTGP